MAQTDRVLGIDCSRWQDDNSTPQQMDFVKAYQAGARFVFIKASQGTWCDEDFLYNWKSAKDAGLYRGAYHYLDASASGEAQAEFFLGLLDQDSGELPPVIDYEYRKQDKNMMYSRLVDFGDSLGNEGIIPMIYTSPYYWDNWGEDLDFWKQFPLWIANYEVNKPNIPLPWIKEDYWQWTDKGDGIKFGAESYGLDMNWYNGTWLEFCARYGTLVTDPPVEDYEKGYENGYCGAVEELGLYLDTMRASRIP